MEANIKVNAMGDPCPLPVVKAKKALDGAPAGSMVEVLVDNEIAVQNLTRMAKSRPCGCESRKLGEKQFVVFLTLGEGQTAPSAREVQDVTCTPDLRSDMVVAVDSDLMGSGNEELGRVLMKGFLYAVSQAEPLPEAVLFYNGGVRLTTEGSDSLEDLKAMEAQGVAILSCGTCLNYYNSTEKLRVGEVTNMYEIVERMEGASKVIKP